MMAAYLLSFLFAFCVVRFNVEAVSVQNCQENRCGQVLTVTKNEDRRILLRCTIGRIRVLDAFYGAADLSCGNFPNALLNVREECEGRAGCNIPAASTTNLVGFGGTFAIPDDEIVCPGGTPEIASITYTCDCDEGVGITRPPQIESFMPAPSDIPFVQFTCEGDVLNLSCDEPGAVIQIFSADYGRRISEGEQCPFENNHQANVLNCRSSTSNGIISTLCNGQAECQIRVTNGNMGGDPCTGTYKYLETRFICSVP